TIFNDFNVLLSRSSKNSIAATIQRTGIRSISCPKLITDLYKKSYPCPVLAAKREIGAGKITAAKVAIRINGRRRILENSILSILSNPNTPCDLLEIILQGVMAKLGADNRHILHYQKFIYCRHIKGSVIKPQSMFILHGIILHMKFML